MLTKLLSKAQQFRGRADDKGGHELAFWRERARAEGVLANAHYQSLYTDMFGVDVGFYLGKRVLDIGCGPRGSLEWAHMAAERVGLDPLADAYREFGTDRHAMHYLNANSEAIPAPDNAFDVVTSINSLDHVDDLGGTLAEIKRVLRPGGSFLLEVEVGHGATPTEPISIWFDLLDTLVSDYDVAYERRYEPSAGEHYIHAAYLQNIPYDMNASKHPGVWVLRLQRR